MTSRWCHADVMDITPYVDRLRADLAQTAAAGDEQVRTAAVHRILHEGTAARAHVFNLGHGVPMDADPDAISAVVRTVHDWRMP